MPPTIVHFGGFSCEIPEEIVMDASFLLRAIPVQIGSRRHVSPAARFLNDISRACARNQSYAFVCLHSLEECYYVILKYAIESDPSLTPQRAAIASSRCKSIDSVTADEIVKADPPVLDRFIPRLVHFRKALDLVPVIIATPEWFGRAAGTEEQVDSLLLEHIRTTRLMPADALVAASTQMLLSVLNIAAVDRDFSRLSEEYTIYTE